MNHHQKHFSPSRIALAVLLAAAPMGAWAATAPDMGTAAGFSVLGGAGVTCTDSTITGAVGSLVTVIPTATCTIAGAVHAGDAVASAAYSNFLTAYTKLASNAAIDGNVCPSSDPTHNLSGNLGGMTLAPGVYCISGVGLLTSKLTLNGPSNGIWVFKAATSLTPIGGSVVMAGGGRACNVYWQTGTEGSLDATQFLGNILAGSAVTFTGVGSSLVGRALAKTAVTMTGTSVIGCDVLPVPGGGNGNGNNCGNGHHDGDDDGHDNGHHNGHDKDHKKCNQGVGNGGEDCDPGNSNNNPWGSNDEHDEDDDYKPGNPGRSSNNHRDD